MAQEQGEWMVSFDEILSADDEMLECYLDALEGGATCQPPDASQIDAFLVRRPLLKWNLVHVFPDRNEEIEDILVGVIRREGLDLRGYGYDLNVDPPLVRVPDTVKPRDRSVCYWSGRILLCCARNGYRVGPFGVRTHRGCRVAVPSRGERLVVSFDHIVNCCDCPSRWVQCMNFVDCPIRPDGALEPILAHPPLEVQRLDFSALTHTHRPPVQGHVLLYASLMGLVSIAPPKDGELRTFFLSQTSSYTQAGELIGGVLSRCFPELRDVIWKTGRVLGD